MNLLTVLTGGAAESAATQSALSLWDSIAVLTLFGGIGWAIAAGVIFLISIFWSDYSENGFVITFSFVALLALFHFWGSAPLWDIFPLFSWKFLALYFSIGLGYSILKTFLYSKKKAKQASQSADKDDVWRTIKHGLKGNVFRWWFAWPVSFIVWIFGDLLSDVFSAVWTRIRGGFEKIAKAGIDAGMNSKED
jgi:hypothetical protein